MKYCKNCGTELNDADSFCEKCGTKIKSKPLTKIPVKSKGTPEVFVSSSNKHILPAILSFLIPSLGQFIKGQVKWGLIILLWFILGNLLLSAMAGIFGRFTIVLMIIYNFFLWIYQIYDAYVAPEIEPKNRK